MQSLNNVVGNAVEDTIDDMISTFLFSEMRQISEPLKDKGSDLSILQEAKNNLVTMIAMGLTLWAYQRIMKVIEKILVEAGLVWAYIVTGKLTRNIANLAKQRLRDKNLKGKKALHVLGAVVGTDKTAERIQVAKMIKNDLRQVDASVQFEKQNKIAIENKMATVGVSTAQIKGISSKENFNLYLHKTKTSTWKNTQTDKKLFEKVTGQTVEESNTSWSSLVDVLNNYSEFAKDTEGKIYNLTEAILRVINRTNFTK